MADARYFSEPKITITVGQALLLLIEEYQDDKEALAELKQLYLTGNCTHLAGKRLHFWLDHELLRDYHVSYQENDINDDTSRRYFETHLAMNSLRVSLRQLSFETLNNHLCQLFGMLPASLLPTVKSIFTSTPQDLPDDEPLDKEYCDAIFQLAKNINYKFLSPAEKEKLELILKATYISIRLSRQFHEDLPMYEVYDEGFFHPNNRGRIQKMHNITGSFHLGLMKTTSPVPSNDMAFSETSCSYLRTVDAFDYDPIAMWSRENFSYLVHPFSSSISGTMLSQLKVILWLLRNNAFMMNQKHEFHAYLKSIMCFLVYHGGGHTLFEAYAVYIQAGVLERFKRFPSMEELFIRNNDLAFDRALDKALRYNKIILQRAMVREELKLKLNGQMYPQFFYKHIQKPNLSLFGALISCSPSSNPVEENLSINISQKP